GRICESPKQIAKLNVYCHHGFRSCRRHSLQLSVPMAIPGHARHQCHSHINCAVLPVNQHPLPGSSKCADSSHYPAKLKWICQILDDILCGRPNRHIGPLHWISPILLYPTAARSLHVRDCTELLLTSCICFRLLCQSIGSFSWK